MRKLDPHLELLPRQECLLAGKREGQRPGLFHGRRGPARSDHDSPARQFFGQSNDHRGVVDLCSPVREERLPDEGVIWPTDDQRARHSVGESERSLLGRAHHVVPCDADSVVRHIDLVTEGAAPIDVEHAQHLDLVDLVERNPTKAPTREEVLEEVRLSLGDQQIPVGEYVDLDVDRDPEEWGIGLRLSREGEGRRKDADQGDHPESHNPTPT